MDICCLKIIPFFTLSSLSPSSLSKMPPLTWLLLPAKAACWCGSTGSKKSERRCWLSLLLCGCWRVPNSFLESWFGLVVKTIG